MDDARRDREALDELGVLADELLERAAEIRSQWRELGLTLGIDVTGPEADATDAAPAGDPVRLVALDMMLSGASRGDVIGHLRATFGDEVDERVVDDVFRGA